MSSLYWCSSDSHNQMPSMDLARQIPDSPTPMHARCTQMVQHQSLKRERNSKPTRLLTLVSGCTSRTVVKSRSVNMGCSKLLAQSAVLLCLRLQGCQSLLSKACSTTAAFYVGDKNVLQLKWCLNACSSTQPGCCIANITVGLNAHVHPGCDGAKDYVRLLIMLQAEDVHNIACTGMLCNTHLTL